MQQDLELLVRQMEHRQKVSRTKLGVLLCRPEDLAALPREHWLPAARMDFALAPLRLREA